MIINVLFTIHHLSPSGGSIQVAFFIIDVLFLESITHFNRIYLKRLIINCFLLIFKAKSHAILPQ